MDFAHHRQLFLTEQGYSYEILDESDLAEHGLLKEGLGARGVRGAEDRERASTRPPCPHAPVPPRARRFLFPSP